jgi:predicted O-linked N-acetylglucosamine transferase (SPINDLY family)
MPRCFLLYSGDTDRSQRPVQGGGSIIFGALNKELKNSSACLECWRKILAQVPESKLVLKLCVADMEAEKRHYYMDALHLEDPGRLRLVPYLDSEDAYARLFSNIDILLDTFPYSGTTTTCNAMSASIPVVTLYNPNIHAHNVSASILAHSGFGELIAYTDTEYVKKAVDLARSTAQLQSYRSRIRDGFLKLMNPSEFMTGYEGLLKQTVTVEAKRWVGSTAADAADDD